MSPEVPDADKIEKKIFKAAIINTDELVKSQARDIGDAKMTESKEDRDANWFTRNAKRIWKHNIAQEWYRQREISRAKKDILEKHDLYVGEKGFNPDTNTPDGQSHTEAMQAIIDRFTSEYEDEEVLHTGETRKTIEGAAINTNIKELIKRYVKDNLPDEEFDEQKKRILSKYDKRTASDKSLYADNLLAIANEVKSAVAHGTKLAELDFDVEITLGNARESLSTEAHNTFDKAIDGLQNTKIGKYLANEPAVLGILAGAYELGRNSIQRTVRSKGLQWATFGGAALLAGGISAVKERARFTRERAQHQREQTKGMEFKEPDMKRRKEMGETDYETKKAASIIEDLGADLAKMHEGDATNEEINAIVDRLAELESRIKLNDQEKIDLITYDKFNTVEKDRTAMDLGRAELKVALRRAGREFQNGEEKVDFDTALRLLTESKKTELLGGESGITAQNKEFAKLRNSRAWKAFATTTLASATVGVLFQEGKALLDASQDGIIEGTIKHFNNKEDLVKHGTGLEALRRWFTGDHAMMPHNDASLLHEGVVAGGHLQLPKGINLKPADGTNNFDIVRDNGNVVVSDVHMEFDENGDLSDETKQALAKSGVISEFGIVGEKTTETVTEPAQDYLDNHAGLTQKIHRELWYDNDTPHPFDGNELRTDWGGDRNTGIDANGNYVFNVSRMTEDGSFHSASSVDAKEAIGKGNLKMLFSLSRDTQHQVFEVQIDADGNAIIDPKSELGKLLFENQNGHAVFTGKFAEVAQSMGTAEDGGENVRILGTHVGLGKDTVTDIVPTDTTVGKVLLDIPEETTYDTLVVPIVGPRRPLERGKYAKDATVESNRAREAQHRAEDAENRAAAGTAVAAETAYIAGGVSYSPDRGVTGFGEYTIGMNTDHVYGFVGLDRKTTDARLKDVKKYTHPEVIVFEEDTTKRDAALKQIQDLKRWYPRVKFTYIALPTNMDKVEPKEVKKYTEQRFKYILESSSLDKKVRHELYVEESLEKELLADVESAEWEAYVRSNYKASDERLYTIAWKEKNKQLLSHKERIIYEDNKKAVDKLIGKIK